MARQKCGQVWAEAGPTFYADAIACARSEQPKKSRVEVYVQVPHDEIRFIKEGDQYIGRYEVTLSLFTSSKQLTHEESWSVDVPVSDFAETTQNKLYSLTHRTVEIDPGNYQITLQMRDQESRKASQIRKSLLVTDFSKDSLALSDIMLVNRLSTAVRSGRSYRTFQRKHQLPGLKGFSSFSRCTVRRSSIRRM